MKKYVVKKYVKFNLKYSVGINKSDLQNSIKQFNFPWQNTKDIWCSILKSSLIKSLIYIVSIWVVLLFGYVVILLAKELSHEFAIKLIDDYIDLMKSVGFWATIGIIFLAFIKSISDHIKKNKLKHSIDKVFSEQKNWSKHMIVIKDDFVTCARIKLKGTKFVGGDLSFKTWSIRNLRKYDKYGIKNIYILATTSRLIPLYLKPKEAKKLQGLIDAWVK